jgi:hypothetical protein
LQDRGVDGRLMRAMMIDLQARLRAMADPASPETARDGNQPVELTQRRLVAAIQTEARKAAGNGKR